MSEKARTLKRTRAQLDTLLEKSEGGRTAVLDEARAASQDTSAFVSSPTIPNGSFNINGGSTSARRSSVDDTTLLRRRPSTRASSGSTSRVDMEDPLHVLTFSPRIEIAELAILAADLTEDLTSRGKEKVAWPANITYLNYLDYLLIPTLVYEMEYPRTSR